MQLSSQQVEQFWQDGFLIVENLLHEQEIATLRERADWVATGQAAHIELKASSCSFHHGLILHCSRLNLSDRRRHGYATHYVSAHCRYTGDPAQNDALLVRGSSQPGCI